MSEDGRQEHASSGVFNTVGGSIKRPHMATFDVREGSPCKPRKSGIRTITAIRGNLIRMQRPGAKSVLPIPMYF